MRTIDDLWADYLATITDLREGVQWLSWGGRDPLHEYLTSVHSLFTQLEEQLDGEIARRLEEAEAAGPGPLRARRHLDLPDHRSAVRDRYGADHARVGAKIGSEPTPVRRRFRLFRLELRLQIGAEV